MVSSRVAVGVPIKPGVEAVAEQDHSFSNQIMILFSAPLLNEDLSPVENLSIQKEIEAIALVLEEIPQTIAVEIVVKVATSQTLQDVLASRVKPLVIHFIGHGAREGNGTALVLEDEVGMTRALSEAELEIALSNQKQAPCQLALLNACHSSKLAQAFVKAGVPHVIAVNAEDKILDVAARCFARRLYQALFNQDAISDSFLVSRNAVKLDDNLKKLFNSKTFQQGVNFDQAFKFQLLPQATHNQSLIIEPADTHQVICPQWSNTNIPRNDPNFIGRRKEIHQVLKVLAESDKRCLALHGMGGMGKTALAYAIGRWLHERDRFRDGVWLISLRDTDSVGTLFTKIRQELELDSFALARELRNSRILLILDDLDKLIEKEPNELIDLLNSLVEQCPNLRLLLTSRSALVRDILYCHQEEVCSMGASETREIFRKYAPSEEQWGLDEESEADFKRLVQFLDGYPLPIKLAASYMRESQYTLKMLCEDLEIEPLEILDSYSPQARKERSLRITLERSFEMLSLEAQDIFPLLFFFPGGLSRELARNIWGRNGNKAVLELFKFSMAEKSPTASDWRVTLPEPARSYAESKLQQGRGIEYLAPQVLDFYYGDFCDQVLTLGESKKRQQLQQENSNLVGFLRWGYEQETNSDKICRSAKITAFLSPYWRWIEANQDPLHRLNLALAAAQRNQDREGENLVKEKIADLAARGEFKDVQTLSKESAAYYTEDLGNGITLEMITIPSGTFIMGSPAGEGYDDERPQYEVNVPSFFMGKYPITQAQYQQVMGKNPSYFQGEERPLETVSWDDAVEFCQKLSQQTGKEYQLPSEAEWEYACRAGTTTPYHFGDTITDKSANYGGIVSQTTNVGTYPPNTFGLYDMHGNVWEWCEDDWHKDYKNAPTDGSAWLSENVSRKVIRGGSWGSTPDFCRSAIRSYNARDYRSNLYFGFRVVYAVSKTT
ncbi:MAG: SUMF1/EgtB/PvdO family nonheme iron enzyme [Cyanobacteria bacterium P01_G01_bin.39]